MIQYNYLDEHWQSGREGLEYIHAKGLPLFIMEPVRGGLLADSLPESAKALFGSERSYASRAMRWVMNHPEVTIVLSGMNTVEQVLDNVRTADDTPPNVITAEEYEVYSAVRAEIQSRIQVPCTACGYCLPCPKRVLIPDCFYYLNDSYLREDKKQSRINFANFVGDGKITACVKCKKCESHCPQHIAISSELDKVKARFDL
jgi:predicted aldo/keto reductase-like oxidoreductase